MNDTIDPKNKPSHHPVEKKMLVRYGKTGILGWFTHEEKTMPKALEKVMIKTERGLEIGRVVGRFCYKSCAFKKTEEAVVDYYGAGQAECPVTTGGRMVRYATEQDISEEHHIDIGAKEELAKCKQVVAEMNLPMKLVDIEHIFGGERVIFYFTAESRIDFRELKKTGKRIPNPYRNETGRLKRRSKNRGRYRSMRSAMLLRKIPENTKTSQYENG
jgi:cell fate regulator YaaT (PSP1 superfamily)